ncbi:MAG: GntR family transcriptional regulator [Albidovulum sp.]|nr:GntR family transcriptional regulator [Albidovulum sp.]MDE0304915.1 GntR family transcriptional regulator [Albidovulum sp.]MDE0530182.1 GntR family transcriptional regulator [Albidovulum sp.]
MNTLVENGDLPVLTLDKNTPVTAQVYSHIRQLILRLHLKPGEALSEQELSVKLGLSRTPVREAFIRLADEGLVDVYPQRGTLVAPIRIAEVKEAHFIRRVLEFAIVRSAAENAGRRHLALLEENLRLQAKAQRRKDYESLMDHDEAFHRLLSESVALPRAWRVIQSLMGQLDRVRYRILPKPGHGDLVRQQHVAIFRAIQAGDADRAEHEMREHLDQIWATIEQLMRDDREFFTD